jgi:hypothetical protein
VFSIFDRRPVTQNLLSRAYQGQGAIFRLDLARIVSQNASVIRVLITYVSILVISLAALFRTRREQAIVELALRQQLAPTPRSTLGRG